MRNIIVSTFILICFISIIGVYASSADQKLLSNDSAVIDIFEKKSKNKLGRVHFFSQEVNEDGKRIISFFYRGEGDYDKYEDVQWKMQSQVLVEEGQWKILRSETVIVNDNSDVLVRYEKTYDYNQKEVFFKEINQEGEVVKEKKYSINGYICDDVTLVHYFRSLLINKKQDEKVQFYLLTNEPRLYKVNAKKRESEVLNFPFGQETVDKYQLIGDMGPLSELAAKFVPPTYVWYSQKYPFYWLQYEGMESGYGSRNITTRIINHPKFAF